MGWVRRVFRRRIGAGGLPAFHRPLTAEEKRFRLDQSAPQGVPPRDFCNSIRLNSACLEIADGGYQGRGLHTEAGIAFAAMLGILTCMAGYGAVSLLHSLLSGGSFGRSLPALAAGAAAAGILALVFGLLTWSSLNSVLHEFGRLTHYPIRFCRKNRRVYVFGLNGAVTAFSWEQLHFCLVSRKMPGRRVWSVMAYRLRPGSGIIEEGFPLPAAHERPEVPAAFWEFVRTFMECGPDRLPPVRYFLPLDREKETPALAEFKSAPPGGFFCGTGVQAGMDTEPAAVGFCRTWAMRSSTIPVWPEWAERECSAAPDDPFAADSSGQPPFTREHAAVLAAADAEFLRKQLTNTDISGTALGQVLAAYPQPASRSGKS